MKTISSFLRIFLISLILAGILWAMRYRSQGERAALDPAPKPGVIEVQIVGAVMHPGLYVLNEDSRVLDAVIAAGGFVSEADTHINLAAHVHSGQNLEIPYIAGSVSHSDQAVVEDLAKTPPPFAGNNLIDPNLTPSANGDVPAVPLATAIPASCYEEVIGSGAFVWPTDNHFLSGNDYLYQHPGIDIAAGMGAPIYAADSGMVRSEGNDNSGYGNVVEIDHGNGYSTVYAHLSVIGVRACQSVSAGQWIGAAGSTGNSSGAHLHFEVMKDGQYINPWSVLPAP